MKDYDVQIQKYIYKIIFEVMTDVGPTKYIVIKKNILIKTERCADKKERVKINTFRET